MRGYRKAIGALALALFAAGCGSMPSIVGEQDLMAADRAFAERARQIGPAAAYAEVMDPREGLIVRPGVTFEGDGQFGAAFVQPQSGSAPIWTSVKPSVPDATGLTGAPKGQPTAPARADPKATTAKATPPAPIAPPSAASVDPALGASNADQVLLNWQPDRAHISYGGDLGVTSGRFVQSRGAQVLSSGRYVIVWRKDASGRWRALIEIGNNDPPSP